MKVRINFIWDCVVKGDGFQYSCTKMCKLQPSSKLNNCNNAECWEKLDQTAGIFDIEEVWYWN